jgi:hypothetical protein
MGKMLSLLLGLAVVSVLAWKVVTGRRLTNVEGTPDQTPHEVLQNAKGAAKRIEANEAKQLDETLEKAAPRD